MSTFIFYHTQDSKMNRTLATAPFKTKVLPAAVGKAVAETQAKQAEVKDLKNIDIDSQHLNYEFSSIPRESW